MNIIIGGDGRTRVNFGNIGAQVQFMDTIKYFLRLNFFLGKIASTLDDVEKVQVEKLTLQFLNQQSYFSRTWKMLNDQQKRKVLDIIVSGKGVVPYEKINSIDSINIKPENGRFLSKDE